MFHLPHLLLPKAACIPTSIPHHHLQSIWWRLHVSLALYFSPSRVLWASHLHQFLLALVCLLSFKRQGSFWMKLVGLLRYYSANQSCQRYHRGISQSLAIQAEWCFTIFHSSLWLSGPYLCTCCLSRAFNLRSLSKDWDPTSSRYRQSRATQGRPSCPWSSFVVSLSASLSSVSHSSFV